MAKQKKFNLDSLNLNADLDLPNYDFESSNSKVKNDRTPISDFGKGLGSGLKSSFTGSAFIRSAVKKALPEGYGAALDVADQTANSMRNLYNEVGNSTKPLINDARRLTKKLLPQGEKFLPKSATDFLKKFGEGGSNGYGRSPSADDFREATIQNMTSEIFKIQTEERGRERLNDEIKDRLRDNIEQKRFKENYSQMEQIRIATVQNTAFNTKVGAAFMRKSLEVQYRQYFVMADLLAETRKSNQLAAEHRAAIVKNTALPDIAKFTNKEILKQTIFDKRRQFVNDLTNNFGKILLGRAKEFAMAASQGMSNADDMHGMMDSMGGMEGMPSGHNMTGNFVGSMIGDTVANRFADKWGAKARARLMKNQKVSKSSNNLMYGILNAPQLAKKWANSRTKQSGLLGDLVDMVKETVQATGNVDNSLAMDKPGNLGQAVSFNKRTARSINEIIPGYLARIHQELRIMRTGNDKVGTIAFDHSKGRFDESHKVQKRAMEGLIDKNSKDYTKYQVDRMMKSVDPKGNLTPEQRAILGRTMIKDNINHGLPTRDRVGNASFYQGEAAKHANVFASTFNDYYKDDHDNEKRNALSSHYTSLGYGIQDVRAKIQDMIDDGHRELLEDAGIVKDGKIDPGAVYEYFGGKEHMPKNVDALPSKLKSGIGAFGSKRIVRQAKEPSGIRPTSSRSYNRTTNNYTSSHDGGGMSQSIKISEVMRDTLLRIEDRLAHGLLVHDSGAGGGGDFVGPTQPRKGPWWNMPLSSLPGAGLKLGGNLLSGVVRSAGKLQDRMSGIGNKAFGALGSVASWSMGQFGKMNDIWVKGEMKPRLMAWKLKAGHYRDQATGEIIKSYKDIKGAIIDEEGNLVLDIGDIKKSFVKSAAGDKVLTALTSIKDFAVGRLSAANDTMNNIAAAVPGIAGKGLSGIVKVYDTVRAPTDVYVKGKVDPVLLAKTFRSGGYFSRITGRQLKRPAQIDGPVVDDQGDIVLTAEELASGLLDKDGKPLIFGLAKVGQILGGMARRGIGALTAGMARADSFIGKGMDFVKNFFGGLIGPEGLVFAGGKKMVNLLTQIRDILDDRLPGHKKVFGDVNGDGIREGSAEDLNRKDAARAAQAQAAQNGGGVGGPAGGLFSKGGVLAGLLGKLKGKDKEVEKDENGNPIVQAAGGAAAAGIMGKAWGGLKRGGGWLAGKLGMGKGAAAAAEGAAGVAGAAGKLGLLSKLGRFGKFGKMLGIAGTAMGAYDTYKDLKQGHYGDAALSAGETALWTGVGRKALWQGAKFAATRALPFMAEGIVAGAAGLAALITLPVLIGAAAVAAVGVGAYYGYKYLTRKKLTPLSKIRYAQYGFLPTDDAHFKAIFEMEDELMKNVTFKNGVPSIDGNKVKVKDIAKAFGKDPGNDDEMQPWMQWMQERFKPVFLTHIAALHALDAKVDLADIDDMKLDQRKKYVEDTSFPEGPYSFEISPFADLKALPADASVVKNVIAETKDAMDKEVETGAKKDGVTAMKVVEAGAGGVAAAAETTKTTPIDDKAKAGTDGVGTGTGAGMKPLTLGAATTASGLGAAYNATAGVHPDDVTSFSQGRMDAQIVVRYKTYGLVDMELEKARALSQLETLIGAQVTYSSAGIAEWNGSTDDVLTSVGAAFGVQGVANVKAYDFVGWFKMRFLPTFLNWATASKKKTNKLNPVDASGSVKPQDGLDIAMAVITSKASYNGSTVSVWEIPSSPWSGYTLNNDVSTTDKNMQGLRDLAKQLVAPEDGGKGSGVDMDTADKAANAKALKSAGIDPKKNQTLWQKMTGDGSKLATAWQATKDTVKAGATAVGQVFTSGVNAVVDGAKAVGSAMGIGSNEIVQPGKGTGGDINAIPKPTGNKSWAAVKNTIIAAAKMVGVDEKLMASIAGIESNFDYMVKAPTSSALGLYQFIDGTWKGMLKKYGAKYGIDPSTPATDPRANALMGGEFLKENISAIKQSVKRPLTDTDLYMAHFLGAGAARKFLAAAETNPDGIGATMFPQEAASNKDVFYVKGIPQTLSQIYQTYTKRLAERGKSLGISSGSEAVVPSSPAGAKSGTLPAVTDVAGNPLVPASSTSSPDMSPDGSNAAASTPSVTAKPKDPGAAAMSSSFNPPASPTDMTAQATYQKQTQDPALGSIDSTLTRSLEVQSKALDTLVNILTVLSNGGTVGANSTAANPAATAAATANAPPRPATPAPISMKK